MDFFSNMTTLLLLCAAIALVNCQEPIVRTKYGDLEGTFDGVSRDGLRFYQFKGIQYAVVQERFESAVEPASWTGIKPAKAFGKVCYDVENHGDENCLFLNVWTAQLGAENANKSVVVYIHGGSFQGGAGDNYGPNYFMDENVVYITINYRLALLGFLSTGTGDAPGNYGLKDQVMALRWIQANIAAFGGDPNKVTIMGQSAGSASVTYHLISPMSKGLFRYAIPQSGTFLDPWAHTRQPFRYAAKVAEALNCPNTTDSKAIISCLKAVPVKTLANRELRRNLTIKFYEDPIAGFGPTIEPLIGDGSNTFLSQSPYDILVSGNFSKVPILSGVVQEEGIYLWAAYLLKAGRPRDKAESEKLQANWSAVAPGAFYFDEMVPPERRDETAQRVQDFYFNSGFDLEANSTFPQLSHLYSDRMFVASAVRFMNLYARHAPVYPYLYTFNKYVGIEFGWEDLHQNYSLDATHAAELDMLVSPLFNRVRTQPDHDELSENLIKLWTSFIDGGVPTATYGSERNFPAINGSQGLQQWYKLDSDTQLINNIFSQRIAFWESLQLWDDDFGNCACGQ